MVGFLVIALVFSCYVTPSYASEVVKVSSNFSNELISNDNLVSASFDRIEFTREIPTPSTFRTDGVTTAQTYLTETAVLIPDNEEVANRIIAQLANMNHGEKIDTTSSVIIYTNVYYERVTGHSGLSYVDMININGGYNIVSANGTTVVAGELVYGQNGLRNTDGAFVVNGPSYLYTTAAYWNTIMPASWPAVFPGDMGDVGCVYTVTLQRPNGYQWTVQLPNKVY